MKKLTCEMCGGTDLIKQDGMWVCQTCGCKYSVEEAKKMMIEGTVDVSGSTVKIDNAANVENYFKMAESAIQSGNAKEAESYCNKIIEIEPRNYQAWFIKGQAAGRESNVSNVRIKETLNCFFNAIDYAPEDEKYKFMLIVCGVFDYILSGFIVKLCDNFKNNTTAALAKSILKSLEVLKQYRKALYEKCGFLEIFKESKSEIENKIATQISNAAVTAWKNNILRPCLYSGKTRVLWDECILIGDQVLLLIQAAINYSGQDDKQDVGRYKNMIDIQTVLINSRYDGSYGFEDKKVQSRIDKIMKWQSLIKKIEPNYKISERPVPPKSGCYIATAVYGSYDCEQVWTLRRYRDYCLSKTWYGRKFISIYYQISPTLVKWFGDTKMFKKLWRYKLDSIVKKLQEMGYKSTPYKDCEW